MSRQEENVAVAKAGFHAYERGDIEGLLATLDPEIDVHAQEGIPNAGEFHGHDGYLRWASNWFDAWETFEVEPEAFEPVGERHVIVPSAQRGIGRGSGVEVRMNVCYMAEIRDGLVRRLHFYLDRDLALEAALAGERAAAEGSG
jgi:uncharacterized protein